jgi:hypothetical protein
MQVCIISKVDYPRVHAPSGENGMNTLNHTLRRLIELALLVALILFMVFAIRTIGGTPGLKPEGFTNGASGTPAPEEPDSGTPYVPPAQDIAMPVPVVTIFAVPQPTSIPWQVEAGNPYPEPGFAPTETPYPTPTLRPGPTETPLPLVGPAPDASGVIRYLAAGEAGTSLLVSQPVDALGLAKSAPQQQLLSAEISPESDVHPSPDRRYLGMIRNMEVGFFGILIDVSNGEIIPFYPDFNQELFFNWIPDSQRILIRANSRSLWLADPFTGEHITLAVPGYFNVRGAAASPDGSKIVYAYDFGISSEPPQVRMINPDGRDDHLVFDDLYGEYFAWSPDGKKIAFFSNGWMVMNADGSDLRPLVDIRLPHCSIQPIPGHPTAAAWQLFPLLILVVRV